MIYFGFLLVAASIGAILYEQCDKIKRKCAEYKEILDLLICIKGAIATGRRTPKEAVVSFLKNGGGEGIPWLSANDGGERVSSFFREKKLLSSESRLDDEDKLSLAGFLCELGISSLDEERARVEKIISLFEKRAEEVKQNTQTNVKAAWILFIAAALGGFIIIL